MIYWWHPFLSNDMLLNFGLTFFWDTRYKNFALYWYEKKIKNIISFLPIEKKFGSAGDSKQEFFLGLTLSTTITTAGPVYNVTLHLGSGHYLWGGPGGPLQPKVKLCAQTKTV